jgi:methionyl aminopeptidase
LDSALRRDQAGREVAVVILDEDECRRMREAGQVAAATLAAVARRVRPGISTADIDRWVREETHNRGAEPSQLGYRGFPAAVCTSRNDVVCHGIPREDERVVDGDILNVDVTSRFGGMHGDTSRTLVVGRVPPEAMHAVNVCKECLWAGIREVRPGARLGDVGAAIEAVASARGCSVVREFGGHGIGRHMHMPPHVAHHGPPRRGLRLRPGMAFTIEPMITIGAPRLVLDDDGWTVRTEDRSPSAQFEHTILVTASGYEILTAAPDDPSSRRTQELHGV